MRKTQWMQSRYLIVAYAVLLSIMSCEITDRAYGWQKNGFLTDIPTYAGNVLLSRPTANSVELNLLSTEAASVQVVYGINGESTEQRTSAVMLKPGLPERVMLSGLQEDAAYHYRIMNANTGDLQFPANSSGNFHTARTQGASFRFAVQADSHLDGGCIPALYEKSLEHQRSSNVDFLIDLGDTFMTGKHEDRASAARQYDAQRYYFGLVGHSVPLFLVLGNHDGEEARGRDNALALWSLDKRKNLFPNPEPNAFYSGNANRHPGGGSLQNYYAWTWGDALFVVLDPYWTSSPNRGGKQPWNMTLGKQQYDWLSGTLRASNAKFKFVFIHQLVGGIGSAGRGGSEAALLYEWGGREADGSETFSARRAGWEKPIHALLVETGVTAVFHGHDHFFARQELDGITYQLVPQPAHRNYTQHSAKEYGYVTGDFLPSSGIVLVDVGPDSAKVQYIRSATPDMERRGVRDGKIAFEYVLSGPQR